MKRLVLVGALIGAVTASTAFAQGAQSAKAGSTSLATVHIGTRSA
jgi:hypothetical protein